MQLRLGLCDTHQRQSSQAVQSNRAPCEIRAKTCHTDECTRVILVAIDDQTDLTAVTPSVLSTGREQA